jgi:hypothetical protein
VSRRPGTAGRSAALTVSAESAVPLPQLPVATVVDQRRLSRAVGFALFMALCAALWEVMPALASWLVSRPAELPLLSLRTALFKGHTLGQLLASSASPGDSVVFGLHTVLVMSLLGAAGFLYSYSSAVRRLAALDNGAC